MRRIQAALPAFGQVEVDFHKESAEVLAFLGENGIQRMRRVPQLGIAASVFTGVNHTRWEYVLLQCALIMLVAKLNKNNETFALSSEVLLSGSKTKISSGEELLKSWVILANSGRPQYTYGVERALLRFAQTDDDFARWLSCDDSRSAFGRWRRAAVENLNGERVHMLLAARGIQNLPPFDRRKRKLLTLLANLSLPLQTLFPKDPVARFKLGRLRSIYKRIRLLSIVTLDAYYSAYPIRVQLNAALSSLSTLCAGESTSDLENVLSMTAGALADEVYLHPLSIATLREYELRALQGLRDHYGRVKNAPKELETFYRRVMVVGLGKPRPGKLRPLARFSFERMSHPLLGRERLFEKVDFVQKELADPPHTYAAVNENPFTGIVHIDLLYSSEDAKHGDICSMFQRVAQWLIKRLSAAALRRVRNMVPQKFRMDTVEAEEMRKRAFATELRRSTPVLREVFEAVLRYVIPEGTRIAIAEAPGREREEPILVRLTDASSCVHDVASPILNRHLSENPRGYSADRLHEISALNVVLQTYKDPVVLVCMEEFTIRDSFGKTLDEWDGVILCVSSTQITITVVEAKNLGNSSSTTEKAFQQLKSSRKYLCERHRLRAQRARLEKHGALLKCTVV